MLVKSIDPPVSTHNLAFLKLKQILRPVHQNLASGDAHFLDLNLLEMRNKIGKYIIIYIREALFSCDIWWIINGIIYINV